MGEALGRSALIVFAKVPVPGRVKTRLTPPLTAVQAAALYDSFLRDALHLYRSPAVFGQEVAVRLYLGGDTPPPDGLVPEGISVHPQRGGSLGARMRRAFIETFASGYERIVIIGTDHPTLPTEFVAAAFDALSDPLTAVLGPSEDGGYYLLGLNELYPALFDMDYSHSQVFADTLDRAADLGANTVVLPSWYDVDDEASLRRLVAEWQDGAPVPTRTAASLEALFDTPEGRG